MRKKLTKLQMAKVVVQALYNMKHLPENSHHMLPKMIRNNSWAELNEQYQMARKALKSTTKERV